MTEEIEPAAYRVVSEIESESDEFYESKHAADTHCMTLHPEKVEGLFAAEDILRRLKEIIEVEDGQVRCDDQGHHYEIEKLMEAIRSQEVED